MSLVLIFRKIPLLAVTALAITACKPKPALITVISASSELKPSANYNYGAALAMDGRNDSSWVEGRDGDGIGEYLKIQLDRPIKLSQFTISNGFGVPRYWKTNNRVRDLIVSGGGVAAAVTLQDSDQPQLVKLPRTLEDKEFIFKIHSVYPGTKDKDTAIAEIVIPGVALHPEPDPGEGPVYRRSPTQTSAPMPDRNCDVGGEMGIQSGDTIKFRNEPSYSARSYTELSAGPGAGDVVRIERCSDGWIYAHYKGHSGWISPKYQCSNLESNCIGAGE